MDFARINLPYSELQICEIWSNRVSEFATPDSTTVTNAIAANFPNRSTANFRNITFGEFKCRYSAIKPANQRLIPKT